MKLYLIKFQCHGKPDRIKHVVASNIFKAHAVGQKTVWKRVGSYRITCIKELLDVEVTS